MARPDAGYMRHTHHKADEMESGDMGNTADELAGKAKETFGDATGNESLEAEGAAQEDNAKAKQDLNDAAEDVQQTEAQEQALDS